MKTNSNILQCKSPVYLHPGDKVALISPAYNAPNEKVDKAANIIRSWGLIPVIGKNVGKTYADHYAGTIEERTDDLLWALYDPDIKAIICNRGGYGAIQLINQISPETLTTHPKWLVGYSDITTLHEMESNAGIMSIHGVMGTTLSLDESNASSTLLRDLLMGTIPNYELPSHPYNNKGKATGTLIGGNLMTFAPLVGSCIDITSKEDIILFIEEVEESYHNIDRQINMLELTGALSRCRGIILGDFTDCYKDLDYESVEAMISQYFKKYNIPVICGFPAGHGDKNYPLVMGAPVTIEVSDLGASVTFGINGTNKNISYTPTQDILKQ